MRILCRGRWKKGVMEERMKVDRLWIWRRSVSAGCIFLGFCGIFQV